MSSRNQWIGSIGERTSIAWQRDRDELVERVRQVCELWLESGAIALGLAFGWASPTVDTTLSDAFNEELHDLADAGCPVIQLEEPQIHLLAARGYVDKVINPEFMLQVFNNTVKLYGLELAN